GNGEVDSIFDASTSARTLLWKQVSRNVADQSTEENFGGNESCKRRYDDSFNLRSQYCTDGSKPFQDIKYDWGEDRLLKQESDSLLGLTEIYGHDALQRLHTWDVAQAGDHTTWQYDYDDWGNIRQREVVNGTTFDSTTYDYTTSAARSSPHAVKRVTIGSST